MSKFVTRIPLAIEQVTAALPLKSIRQAIGLDLKANELRIEWENDDFRTPFTYPVDWPLADLEQKLVPKGVLAVKTAPGPGEAQKLAEASPRRARRAR